MSSKVDERWDFLTGGELMEGAGPRPRCVDSVEKVFGGAAEAEKVHRAQEYSDVVEDLGNEVC